MNLVRFSIWIWSKVVVQETIVVFLTMLATPAFSCSSYVTDANFWKRMLGKIGTNFTEMMTTQCSLFLLWVRFGFFEIFHHVAIADILLELFSPITPFLLSKIMRNCRLPIDMIIECWPASPSSLKNRGQVIKASFPLVGWKPVIDWQLIILGSAAALLIGMGIPANGKLRNRQARCAGGLLPRVDTQWRTLVVRIYPSSKLLLPCIYTVAYN